MMQKAPPQFRPQNILEQGLPLPPVAKSRYKKCEIYKDVSQFQYIDDHAIQVSRVEHKTFRDLMWHLVYSQNNYFNSDLDKARAIFRWMTSKNMHSIHFQNVPRGSPEEVLTSFKTQTETYARIFETLCGYAGLFCTVIIGFAKGQDYRPGAKFKGSDYNHSWNAVSIDRHWHLVDCHWAARFLSSEENTRENLVYQYDDYYFLTDPENLIYSHWSPKTEWQLLDKPVTLNGFEDLPFVKSYFFKCGLSFVSHQKGVIETKKGVIAITVEFAKPTNFTSRIVNAENGNDMYHGNKLKSYVLQETSDNQATFTFRSPEAGIFYLTIFAQMLTGDIGVENVFTAAAEYKVKADQPAGDAVPLPNCSDSNWGPGVPVAQLGLTPFQKDAVITTLDGQVRIEFRKTKPTYVVGRLCKAGMTEKDLESCVKDNYQDDRCIVTARLPVRGEYGLEIYGNDPAKDGDTYTHICQYLIHFGSLENQAKAFYRIRANPEPSTMESQWQSASKRAPLMASTGPSSSHDAQDLQEAHDVASEVEQVHTRSRKRQRCACDEPADRSNRDVDSEDVDDDTDPECSFCFLRPCVTDRTMYWLGDGQRACEENSSIRRTKYSSFWKVLNNLGAWSDPRYLEVKIQRANGGEWAVNHRREVMPVCVLKKVRSLYPNPKGKPYMEHKWK